MSRLVCYIPSYNDSHFAGESLRSSPDWDVVISDNASDEPHASALAAMAGPRIQVVRQEKSLGRVGNWKFCVQHFIESGADWMKFLIAGDLHEPDSRDVFCRAIEKYPDVRCIVPRIRIIWPHRQFIFVSTDQEEVLSPARIMAATVEHGNVFHGLTGPLFHVDAVKDGFSFGEEVLSWSADLLFMIGIAQKVSTVFLVDVTANFIIERRKTMQANAVTLKSYLEDGLVRLRAADIFLELTGDRAARTRLLSHIVDEQRECVRHSLEKLAGDVRYAPQVLTGDVPLSAMPPIRNWPSD